MILKDPTLDHMKIFIEFLYISQILNLTRGLNNANIRSTVSGPVFY